MKMQAVACLVVGSLILLPRAALTSDGSPASLEGLWGSERTFGPEVRGELTLAREEERWHAWIAGFDAPVLIVKERLTFVLPARRGEFRGRLTAKGTRVIGHWIQPPTAVYGLRYATPVELKTTGNNVWRGQVVPLEDSHRLYLLIHRREDGSLGAFIRNPERNLGRHIGSRRVEAEGDVVRLISDQKETDPLVGRVDVYRRPLAEEDGWATASIADVGIDPERITELVRSILGTETKELTDPYIHALLIARHGKLVLEEYFYGYHKDRPHDTRSAGKSLATTLAGIAMYRRAPFDVTTPIYSLFTNYPSFANDSPRKRRITVEHLLTMTSGLDGDDGNPASPGYESRVTGQGGQSDWFKYVLDLPMAHDPGEKYAYFSAGMHLVGGVVERATGTWLPEFLYEQYAVPLDIRHYHVNLGGPETAYMGGGIQMRPRDFMKLGQLFLAGGRWGGRRIMSKEWADRATRLVRDFYGYGWWTGDFRVGETTYRTFSAEGNGGQFLVVVPVLDLVVMFAGGNYGQRTPWDNGLFEQVILPAVKRR